MDRVEWESASEIEWEQYYQAVAGRALRPLFVDALPLLPTPESAGRALQAVDLGCGDGGETLELLARGWTVLAVDGSPLGISRLRAAAPPDQAARLTTLVAPFVDVELPATDFVYAGLSLPFCHPHDFDEVWRRLTSTLRPGGVLAVHLFGPHDSWAETPDMTFRTRHEVETALTGFEIEQLYEQDEDGEAVGGPKHWHVFHVIARRRGPIEA